LSIAAYGFLIRERLRSKKTPLDSKRLQYPTAPRRTFGGTHCLIPVFEVTDSMYLRVGEIDVGVGIGVKGSMDD
jgi:hypothetical protein